MDIKLIHKTLLLLIVCCCTSALSAQNMSVSDFKALEKDLTANTHGTMEKDFNGKTAALIKVQTTELGFVFDGGMTGIVKVKQGIGEVWVYVPKGIKRITIQHPQLGVLRDYYFPIPIEEARTYEMVLVTGKVETIVKQTVNKQFVVFTVKPTDAVVELNGETLNVNAEGKATKGLPYGTYDYRVSCENYHTEAGKLEVTSEKKTLKDIVLTPKFGWIDFNSSKEFYGANVYIDNKRIGELPCKTENLNSGTHRIKVVKSLYKTYEAQVVVEDNKTTPLQVVLEPNFANVTLITDAQSEIWIDNEKKGTGRWVGRLEVGTDYLVETKKASHRTISEQVSILDMEERSIQLKHPTPIYGSLEIDSDPVDATVYLDGKEIGNTPLIEPEVLIGNHQLRLKKDGYADGFGSISISETEENRVNWKLSTSSSSYASSASSASSSSSYNPTSSSYKTYSFNSSYFRDVSLYFDGGIMYAASKYAYAYSMSFSVGTTILGLNVECGFTPSLGASLEGSFATNCMYPEVPENSNWRLKAGWAITCGDSFLVIPQIGYYNMFLDRGTLEDYYSGGYVNQGSKGCVMGCRVMWCFSQSGAICFTPELGLGKHPSYNLGLTYVYNIGEIL